MGLAVAVERSRSGDGAHVWFFFTEPVLASTARRMGCYLITETMARRHELSLESYDLGVRPRRALEASADVERDRVAVRDNTPL